MIDGMSYIALHSDGVSQPCLCLHAGLPVFTSSCTMSFHESIMSVCHLAFCDFKICLCKLGFAADI